MGEVVLTGKKCEPFILFRPKAKDSRLQFPDSARLESQGYGCNIVQSLQFSVPLTFYAQPTVDGAYIEQEKPKGSAAFEQPFWQRPHIGSMVQICKHSVDFTSSQGRQRDQLSHTGYQITFFKKKIYKNELLCVCHPDINIKYLFYEKLHTQNQYYSYSPINCPVYFCENKVAHIWVIKQKAEVEAAGDSRNFFRPRF